MYEAYCETNTNLKWKAGDTEELVLNYKIDDTDQTPVDLTGATGLMRLRRKPSATDVVIEIDATVTEAEGKLTYIATPEQTRSLLNNTSRATYYYDAQCTNGSGTVKTLVSGKVVVSMDVSR